jgi:hypothetical protein
MLKSALQSLVLITRDQGFLEAGATPSQHRGVFVIDAANASVAEVIGRMFRNIDWKKDPVLRNRRFRVSRDQCVEIEPDGSEGRRWW